MPPLCQLSHCPDVKKKWITVNASNPCCHHSDIFLPLPFFPFCLSLLWSHSTFIFSFIFIYLFPPEKREHEFFIRNDRMVMNTALSKQWSYSICPCRKICKNIPGLKICQARINCQVEKTQMQPSGVSLGRTQKVQGREAHHSTQSLKAEVMETHTAFRKIKWPTAANKSAWQDFDTNIGETVKISAKG